MKYAFPVLLRLDGIQDDYDRPSVKTWKETKIVVGKGGTTKFIYVTLQKAKRIE